MLSTKFVYKSSLIYVYILDLASHNLQWLICHRTETNQTKRTQFYKHSRKGQCFLLLDPSYEVANRLYQEYLPKTTKNIT